MKAKLREWLGRYFVAEVIGVLFGLFAGVLAYFFSENLVVTAFVGTWAENLGYYGYISIKDVVKSNELHKKDGRRYGFVSFFKNLRDLFVEFGFSEFFDSFTKRNLNLISRH